MLKKLFIISLLFIFSCGKNVTDNSSISVSILKSKENTPYNAIEHGIIDELSSKNIKIAINQYVSDSSEISTIELANKIKEDNSSIAISIGRTATLLSMNIIVPQLIVFTGIIDNKTLDSIIKNKFQNNNITGVYSILDIKPYIKDISAISNVKSFGYIYLDSSLTSKYISDSIRNYCMENNIEYFSYPIRNIYDIQSELDFDNKKIDLLYIANDSVILEYISDIAQKAEKYFIPIITTDIESALEGDVLFSIDINYYRMGRITANMVYDIIKENKKHDIDLINIEDANEILINEDIAKSLNIVLSDDIKNKATIIIRDGKAVNVSKAFYHK